MAQSKCMDLRALLASALPAQRIEALARRSGVLRRRRKVDPVAWLWTLVLGFGTGRVRTLAGLRRSYERATDESLVPSAFCDRFTVATVGFLRAVVSDLCADFQNADARLRAQPICSAPVRARCCKPSTIRHRFPVTSLAIRWRCRATTC